MTTALADPPRTAPPAMHDDALMFDLAPVSLWLEDYSAVHAAVRGLARRGRERPAARTCAPTRRGSRSCRDASACSRSTAARSSSTARASSPSWWRSLADSLPRRHARPVCRGAGRAVGGPAPLRQPTVNYTLDGRRLDIQLARPVLPGHEAAGSACWSRSRTSPSARAPSARPPPASTTRAGCSSIRRSRCGSRTSAASSACSTRCASRASATSAPSPTCTRSSSSAACARSA